MVPVAQVLKQIQGAFQRFYTFHILSLLIHAMEQRIQCSSLDASLHQDEKPCPSVGWLVRWSVGR